MVSAPDGLQIPAAGITLLSKQNAESTKHKAIEADQNPSIAFYFEYQAIIPDNYPLQ